MFAGSVLSRINLNVFVDSHSIGSEGLEKYFKGCEMS